MEVEYVIHVKHALGRATGTRKEREHTSGAFGALAASKSVGMGTVFPGSMVLRRKGS